MSPLAEAVYDLLRLRPGLPEPRLTYAALAAALRQRDEALDGAHHRDPRLYRALDEVGGECARLGLPSLAALVVRADTRRPGEAYFHGPGMSAFRGERVAAWRRELDAVARSAYPPRGPTT